jgi:hypothetical protein
MIQNVAHSIGGMAGFGIISICLFFTVFVGALIWAVAQRKSHCEHMESLPLEADSNLKGEWE